MISSSGTWKHTYYSISCLFDLTMCCCQLSVLMYKELTLLTLLLAFFLPYSFCSPNNPWIYILSIDGHLNLKSLIIVTNAYPCLCVHVYIYVLHVYIFIYVYTCTCIYVCVYLCALFWLFYYNFLNELLDQRNLFTFDRFIRLPSRRIVLIYPPPNRV